MHSLDLIYYSFTLANPLPTTAIHNNTSSKFAHYRISSNMNNLPNGSSPLQKTPQPITTQCRILMRRRYIAVENIVRKGEIACNKQFLLFSQCFLPYMVLIFHSKCTLKCCLQICFYLDQSKILWSGNGLNHDNLNEH